MEITGPVLELARVGAGMDKEDLAKLLGVSFRTISNWEKNGVPAHRTTLVLSKLGASIRAAQDSNDYQEWLKTPAGMQRLDDDYKQMVANGEIDPKTGSYVGPQRDEYDHEEDGELVPVSALLRQFSTVTLLNEVTRRVRNSSARSSRTQAHTPSFEAAEDPDYSQMSDQDAIDYGLAADKGEDNIGYDELPNEP